MDGQSQNHKNNTFPEDPTHDPRAGGRLFRMEQIQEREMQWLWWPYIPFGSASMLFGPGGLGKSHIVCDIAAAVSTGRPLPGQEGHRKPQKVLMLSAEDDPAQVLKPRLDAAGADMRNIYVTDKSFVLNAKGMQDMRSYMAEAMATVTFIDPAVSFMGGKIDMNKMNEVRTMTGPLQETAQHDNSAVVLVHHSRKGNGGEDFEKAAGSGDFNNAVRSVLYVQRTKGGETWLNHVKTNYAVLGPSIPYNIDRESGKIVWGAQLSDPGKPKTSKVVEAKAWILAFLANGPEKAQVVKEASDRTGMCWATVNRAKEDIARSFLRRTDGTNTWWWTLL